MAGELGRPFAYLQSALRREAFDAVAGDWARPFAVGDAVLAKGQPGLLAALTGSGCTVEFRQEGVSQLISYLEWDGRKGGAGNARLQHIPPSLAPGPREARSDGITLDIIAKVRAHVEECCARSPHTRDGMCRRIAPHLKVTSAFALEYPRPHAHLILTLTPSRSSHPYPHLTSPSPPTLTPQPGGGPGYHPDRDA